MSVDITLSSPITAHGERLTALTLRPLTVKELRQCGAMPFYDAADGSTRVDPGAVAALISTLAGIPTSSVDQMSASDFAACVPVILGFFSASPPTAS